ncbi:uncharacterized protein LOC129922990 isoform X8 [Biomphalaria glabrata]|uniref:Uncharacterized protein LOC129922990 isoform X8 n=1 Tax=Biomphalaria glabrata TaxID=6526 RepID=A0A9W2YXV5_BIOGL|nr:uncharacterized protein LOC129922990 isoform X8 [Biomphalaria glabrata]
MYKLLFMLLFPCLRFLSIISFEMRCGYGEEGSNGTITVKVISREEIVLLLTKTTTDDQIAVCKYNEGRCKKQSQKYNSIYGKLNTTENVLEIIFQNLSRIHLGEMTLSDTGSVRISSYNASCYFNVYDRWNESNKTTAIVDVANLSRTTSLNHRDYSNGYRYITKLKSDSLSVTISTNLQNEEVMTLDNLDIYTINLNGKQDVEDVYCTIEEVWTQRLSFILAGCDKNISNITTEIVYNSPYFKIH